ncbi:gastrula zinc finger protein XlCGF52.1-like [Cryptotermes secundus]|uniref:gastrula zinc finger protein XlCGF52.1-like n=1 Tax=Cryptotermes secundus TaxID=105785 RepID=UPI000CD7ABEE|nr:gastrula zinc finger protein XlCGF52.1-like [Cryptotermes secundus]
MEDSTFSMPRILLQRAEEIFPAVRERMNCTNSENILVDPCGETYSASHDASQAMNIKAEEVSDSQADPVQITFQEIKAEPEDCTTLENTLVGPYGETYPTPHDANQAMNVKAVAVSDAEEEGDPVPITFPKVNAEPEGNLNELQPVHGEEQQYSCDECSESFSQQVILRAHQRTHTGERPFCCGICNKSFSSWSHLKTHQRIHSGEKPFICDVCNKSFISKGGLMKHMYIHTGKPPVCCDVCNKSFSQQSSLKRHQHIHSGEKQFCCDVCNMTFSSQSSLKRHQRIHRKSPPGSDSSPKNFMLLDH